MGSKRTTTICGSRGILSVKSESCSVKTEKTVRIVEPISVREKRLEKEKQIIRHYREKVNEFIYEQIDKRKEEFPNLQTAANSQRTHNRIKKWVLRLLLLWLLFTLVKASLCHAHNASCQLFWYEYMLAAVFGCFTSNWQGTLPIY